MSLFFDEKKNLVSLSNSILSYYGVAPFHDTLKELDSILKEKNRRKICLILLDGFGKAIQEKYEEACPFIRSKPYLSLTSVFPPTTVAATTALVSGKYPCETGWLGWTEKFDCYDVPAIMFYQQLDDKDHTSMKHSSYELCPYEDIFSILNRHSVKADKIQSFLYPELSISQYFDKANDLLSKNDFLYVYHTDPDGLLHAYGVGSKEAKESIEQFDEAISSFVRKNPDTLFLLVADHGHKNTKFFEIDEHKDFFECLKYPFYSLEGRASFFLIKDKRKEEFLSLAKKYYDEHFYIYTKEEVIQNHIFGYGKEANRFKEVLGDFLLISKDESAFHKKGDAYLASHHAGSSKEEREINLSILN